jgi:hypothetical protein
MSGVQNMWSHYFCTVADMCLKPQHATPWKGTNVKAALERGNEKLNGFQDNRAIFRKTAWFFFFPFDFYIIFTSPNLLGHITLNFWILFWPKILKWTLVFLEFFISIFLQFFQNFKFDRPVFSKLVKPAPNGFFSLHKNQSIFYRYFNSSLPLSTF